MDTDMTIEDSFYQAVRCKKYLIDCATRAERLELYALFMQATVGNCYEAKPYMLDYKAVLKWNAWKSLMGLSQHDAMQAYVDKVDELYVLQYI